jgi:hypothetical protein
MFRSLGVSSLSFSDEKRNVAVVVVAVVVVACSLRWRWWTTRRWNSQKIVGGCGWWCAVMGQGQRRETLKKKSSGNVHRVGLLQRPRPRGQRLLLVGIVPRSPGMVRVDQENSAKVSNEKNPKKTVASWQSRHAIIQSVVPVSHTASPSRKVPFSGLLTSSSRALNALRNLSFSLLSSQNSCSADADILDPAAPCCCCCLSVMRSNSRSSSRTRYSKNSSLFSFSRARSFVLFVAMSAKRTKRKSKGSEK